MFLLCPKFPKISTVNADNIVSPELAARDWGKEHNQKLIYSLYMSCWGGVSVKNENVSSKWSHSFHHMITQVKHICDIMKPIDNWLRETLQTPSTVAQLIWDLALEALLRSRLSPACAGSCARLLPHLHWVDPAEPQLPIMEHRWCCLGWRCTRAKGSEFFWPRGKKLFQFLNVKMGLYKSSQRSSACCLGAAWKKGFGQVRWAATGHLRFCFPLL